MSKRQEADAPLLRPLRPEDEAALLELVRAEAEAGRLAGGGELTAADVQNFILAALLTAGDDYRAVCGPEGELAGLIGLRELSPERAEFCIALRPAYRGQGLARPAAEQLLREAFSGADGPRRVYMFTRPDNQAANGFNRALGFRRQEPEADAAPGTAGLNWYGISREEFLRRDN